MTRYELGYNSICKGNNPSETHFFSAIYRGPTHPISDQKISKGKWLQITVDSKTQVCFTGISFWAEVPHCWDVPLSFPIKRTAQFGIPGPFHRTPRRDWIWDIKWTSSERRPEGTCKFLQPGGLASLMIEQRKTKNARHAMNKFQKPVAWPMIKPEKVFLSNL